MHEVLKTKIELWEKLFRFNPSLTELLELTPYENSLKYIAQKNVTKEILEQNEDPILILIQDQSGTSMYSKKFLPNSEFDEQLISAFLFAINNFMQETFAGMGSIDRITYQDYTLLFKPQKPFLVCYAYRGQSYTAQQNLDRFNQRLYNSVSIWQSLVNYNETGLVPELEDLINIENLVDDIFGSISEELPKIIDEELFESDFTELLKSKL